jgi:threonine dehydrogenase-like Zn-dependent dehydrogenase
MASGLIDMTKIVTEEFSLDEAEEAFAIASARQCGQVVIRIGR